MKFQPDSIDVQSISGYGPGWINVNERDIRRSVIGTPERLVTDWTPQTFADLEAAHDETLETDAERILALAPATRDSAA